MAVHVNAIGEGEEGPQGEEVCHVRRAENCEPFFADCIIGIQESRNANVEYLLSVSFSGEKAPCKLSF